MRDTNPRYRHFTSDSVDYGLRTNAIHNPSSGYSYSEAESYEWDRSMNPNVRYIPGESNRDLARRERDYSGVGPKNYRRTDERIYEDVCEVLSRHPDIDASEIEVSVRDGIVFLDGTVETRRVRQLAQEIIDGLPGVEDVENYLDVPQRDRDRRRIARSLS
ncbi:BON domain-containing protein [Bdellovibrio bacteriovorus]|uniref:BON domain-containing protein n=1 Tax=Bdellovibrio bacteriovorus TaxID=959 RepID=UPI0035A7034B